MMLSRTGFAIALLCLAGPADAHIVASRLGDFYAGALHPLTDPRDPLLWVAAGVLGATGGAARARWLVLLFPAGLLTGLIVGASLHLTADPLLLDAGMMVLLGGLLASAVRMPAVVLFAIVLTLGVLRGTANAAGLAPETNQFVFAAGFVAIGYLVITLTMGLTTAFRQPDISWRGIAIRAGGSWIVAIGLMAGGYAIIL